MPSYFHDPANNTFARISPLPTRTVHDCSAPQPDASAAPHTEMTVQLTLSSLAHPDDVAAVIERLQTAIKDATAATGGRLDIQFALPEVVRG